MASIVFYNFELTLDEMKLMEIENSGKNIISNPKELLKLEMLTSFEKFTKAIFKAQYHRSFIVAKHHKRIIEVLQDVVDGKCKRLIINIGPRYGKTELVIKMFIS